MKPKDIFDGIKTVFEEYDQSLDTYTDAQFEFKKDAETWSLSEMYEHVCMSGKKFFLANTKRCLEKSNGQEGGEMNTKGVYVFGNGGFPEVKVKMPESVAAVPIVGQSREVYKNEITEIINSAEMFMAYLESDAGTYKIPHPVFGPLNAIEWFQNLEMHSRHHLRQKAELEKLCDHV
jgi:hypothetical protein